MPDRSRIRNRFICQLSDDDFARLEPHLEWQELELRRRLSQPGRIIDRVYFLESGVASIVSHVRHDPQVEIGLVGRESVANMAALMGTDQSPNETVMQLAGAGFGMDVEPAREAMRQSAALTQTLLRHAHVHMVQMGSTVLANGRGSVAERLARWLLMARDRVDEEDLKLTHEFLSVMLGVRRSGVTVALQELERRGLVEGRRGVVRILDRDALEDIANGYYGSAESEMRRLFGSSFG